MPTLPGLHRLEARVLVLKVRGREVRETGTVAFSVDGCFGRKTTTTTTTKRRKDRSDVKNIKRHGKKDMK